MSPVAAHWITVDVRPLPADRRPEAVAALMKAANPEQSPTVQEGDMARVTIFGSKASVERAKALAMIAGLPCHGGIVGTDDKSKTTWSFGGGDADLAAVIPPTGR